MEENDKSLDRATIRLFWQASMEAPRRYRLLSLLNPVGQLFIYVGTPFFVGKILAQLMLPDGNYEPYIYGFIATAVIGILTNRYGFANMLRLQADTMARLQERGLTALLRRSAGYHNNNVGGKLVSDAIDLPSAYSQLSAAYLANLLPFFGILLIGTVVVFTQSWLLGLIITTMCVYAIGSGVYESRKRIPIRSRRLKVSKAVTAHLADAIVNVQTVKTFAREDDELSRHRKLGGKLLHLRLSDWVSAAMGGNRRITVLFAMQLAFLLALIYSIERDPALLAVGIFGISFVATLSNRLFEVNVMLRQIEEALLMAGPLTQTLLEEPEVQDKPGAGTLKVTEGAIRLTDVTFEYQDSSSGQTVFEQLNLHIRAGEKIGLVGPSGGGKSTLTRLLLRFEDISSGAITIDGQNIADITQASLRQSIAYVPQEPLMFHRTIKENIAYGKPDATLKQIRAAARLAHADDFITELSDGYDTIVGERGVKLSGGQRQRVAIARAILKDAPILLLDEATSALDSESEVLIQDALWKLMEGRTAIVIAHRLSTIQKMDRILVLDNGKIVEEGDHKALLAASGLYAKLWKHQSGGFIEE